MFIHIQRDVTISYTATIVENSATRVQGQDIVDKRLFGEIPGSVFNMDKGEVATEKEGVRQIENEYA